MKLQFRRGLLWVALVAVGVAAGWWAAHAFAAPAVVAPSAAATSVYRVEQGTVGKTVAQAAQASWSEEVVGRARAAGTVTSVMRESFEPVTAGTQLLSVELRPVVVEPGAVPAFRDLRQGSQGPDVAQLQRAVGRPDSGSFDASTTSAVKTWQAKNGFPADGVVRAADIVYVEGLPRRLSLADGVGVGADLVSGADLVEAVGGSPTVVMKIGLDQIGAVPTTGQVSVTSPDGSARPWSGELGTPRQLPSGEIQIPIVGTDGAGPVCGNDCAAAFPLGDPTTVQITIDVVASTTGPVVPTSAITTDAGNQTSVRRPDGTTVPITLTASADGLAVVKGLQVGEQILMPALPGSS